MQVIEFSLFLSKICNKALNNNVYQISYVIDGDMYMSSIPIDEKFMEYDYLSIAYSDANKIIKATEKSNKLSKLN